MVIQSPSRTTVPLTGHLRSASEILISLHPTTQGFPIPRATTAACEVIPPRAVRIPSAACIPPMSSGDVSSRTRITLSPRPAHASASSAVKTTRPTAAPGEAGSPRAMRSGRAIGSSIGWRSRST